jgi:hypothetical protein
VIKLIAQRALAGRARAAARGRRELAPPLCARDGEEGDLEGEKMDCGGGGLGKAGRRGSILADRDENGVKTNRTKWYHICFYIFMQKRKRIQKHQKQI